MSTATNFFVEFNADAEVRDKFELVLTAAVPGEPTGKHEVVLNVTDAVAEGEFVFVQLAKGVYLAPRRSQRAGTLAGAGSILGAWRVVAARRVHVVLLAAVVLVDLGPVRRTEREPSLRRLGRLAHSTARA